ncbi:MAG: FAD:protein FMN transferase [Candidatus Nanopelagicus sp.]
MIHLHAEDVWNTVVTIECETENISYESSIAFLHQVDELFSTYLPNSQVSKLRKSELEISRAHAYIQEVWQGCIQIKELTDGAFDPWAVSGGFDPSGYVKGWAAENISNQLISLGAKHIQVNAGGDISLRGGKDENTPWKIGVAHPDLANEISKIYQISNGAIATSGTAELGNHIVDPDTKTIAIGARSATVVGPDAGIADALATALIVAGRSGASWFSKTELLNYSAWVVDRDSDTTWEILR